MTLKWVRTVLLEKYKCSSHTRLYPKDKMGNCAKKWQLTVQQSCKDIFCFSTCCKGKINSQILSDDGEDLEPGVSRSKQSGKLRWKRSSIQGNKSSTSENNIYVEKWQHGLSYNSPKLCINQYVTTLKSIEHLSKV